jgi:hypothetical protein
MNDVLSNLSEILNRPETHRIILDGYRKAYSLGVTRCQEGPEGLGFLLRVEGPPPPGIPRTVTIDGWTIPVLVQGEFKAPKPLSSA